MIDRILVPLDGSRVAEQIFPHLRRLLYRRDAEVILVRAVLPPPIEDGMVMTEALEGAALDYLAQIQDRLEAQGVRVKSQVRVGSAAGVILELVEEERATMVAMATHGATGLKRFFLGSVAESVLRRSPVPVLVVRPFWSYELLPNRTDREDLRPIRSILLPVDGTDDASVLITPLTELARLFEARVILLHVLEEGSKETVKSGDQLTDHQVQVAGFLRKFQDQGVETLSVMGRGDPVRDILSAAREHEIDLIAMADHGNAGFLWFFSSTITEKVLHESTCPMLVMRAEVAAGQGGARHPVSGATKRDRS